MSLSVSGCRITRLLIGLLFCVLFTAGGEVVKRLQELEGNTVTLHPELTAVQSDAQILWFYRPEKSDIKIVDSLVIKGEINTEYNTNRFRDRLQLNRSSGSLTIRKISREDSGLYSFQMNELNRTIRKVSVVVYAPVSKPVITNSCSGHHTEWCSPMCSVEKREDVSLSWYEDKERISSISTADFSVSSHLHLPLNRTFPNNYTYTCVSDNPVSNQTAKLNNSPQSETVHPWLNSGLIVAVVVLIVAVVVLIVAVAICCWKKKTNQASETGQNRMGYDGINQNDSYPLETLESPSR